MIGETIRSLYVTSECAPLAKTGGLADVSAALPAALRELSVDVRMLMPAYRGVLGQLEGTKPIAQFPASASFPGAQLLQAYGPQGVPLLLVECAALYERDGGPYQDPDGAEWQDNALRFGLLSRIAAELGSARSPLLWHPQVVHCNDWQAGLAPAYLRFDPQARARSLITIHNLAFQGIFEPHWVGQLGLPAESFGMDGIEYYGKASFLKAALAYADAINTVSPTYAAEIQREPLGMGLQGLLHARRGVLEGILNGVDTAAWNPADDPAIAQTFDARAPEGKRANKRALQAQLGLEEASGVPLLAIVSRLTEQKGIDVVLEAAAELLELPAQLAVLGSGQREFEDRLRQLAAGRAGRAAVRIGFDEGLAHRIEAGADIFLMPSRFEPCGMNQMYSQRYGTVPLVHATGGLLDSVVDCTAGTLAAGTATGFIFRDLSAQGLLRSVRRALEVYRMPAAWRSLQIAGMQADFSWGASARRYREIYARLAGSAALRV